MDTSLRVAIVVEEPVVPAWQARVAQALAEVDGVVADIFVIGTRQMVARRSSTAWSAYEKRVLRRSTAFLPIDLAGLEPKLPIERGALGAVAERGADVVLSFLPPGSVDPEPVGMPRHGVWEFRFGDGNSGAMPAPDLAAEVSHRPGVMRSKLVASEGTSTTVMRTGAFRTVGQSIRSVLDAMYMGGVDWPASVCRVLVAGSEVERTAASSSPSGNGSSASAAVVAGRAARYFITWQTERLMWAEGWTVGIVDAPIHTFLSGERPPVRWIAEPSGPRVLADPFGVRVGDRLFIVCEEWDLRRGPGLCSIQIAPDGEAGPISKVEGLPQVASYPFLFEHEGDVYCVPETAHDRVVTLYRATSFPSRWEPVHDLVQGKALADPTVFRHEDRWWLFCNDVEGRHGRLAAFYSEELSGPWRPHVGNPIKSDVRSSRPAGTPFVHDGNLYRPAQDSSRTYGGAVVINRILSLSPTEFREEIATVVTPDPDGPYPRGLHTVSAAGDMTLIDGKRRRFEWASVKGEASSILRRRLGSGRSRTRGDT